MKSDADQVVDDIFGLYEKHGNEDYIGEPVSQLEHMSQAAQLALQEGSDDDVVLAAFFHDIGHICVSQNATNSMEGYGIKSHEKIGGDFLRQKGFPDRLARLVESHVPAKRYLTFKYPEYYDALSDASKKTLTFQGGKMDATEAEDFEKVDIFEASIRLRKWDELAKETEIPIIDLNEMKALARKILQSNG